MLIESNKLDKLRPRYEATLVVCTEDGLFSVSVPCQGMYSKNTLYMQRNEHQRLFLSLTYIDAILSSVFDFIAPVNPGPLQIVKALPPILENQVLPGCSIQEFMLEVLQINSMVFMAKLRPIYLRIETRKCSVNNCKTFFVLFFITIWLCLLTINHVFSTRCLMDMAIM